MGGGHVYWIVNIITSMEKHEGTNTHKKDLSPQWHKATYFQEFCDIYPQKPETHWFCLTERVKQVNKTGNTISPTVDLATTTKKL